MVDVGEHGKALIVELANGFRVDLYARHSPTGAIEKSEPSHFPTLQQARQFANVMAMAGRLEIEEQLRTPRA